MTTLFVSASADNPVKYQISCNLIVKRLRNSRKKKQNIKKNKKSVKREG